MSKKQIEPPVSLWYNLDILIKGRQQYEVKKTQVHRLCITRRNHP